MEYELIWEAPLHEFGWIQNVSVLFSLVFLPRFIQCIYFAWKEENTMDYIIEGIKNAVIVVLILGIETLCYFNDWMTTSDTCKRYHNGDFEIVEGEISDFDKSSRSKSFLVKDVVFVLHDGTEDRLFALTHTGEFMDLDNAIRENGQKVRIAYCRNGGPEGSIARIELKE